MWESKTAFIHDCALLAMRVAQNLDDDRLMGCLPNPVRAR
jgi:hypothetical protein